MNNVIFILNLIVPAIVIMIIAFIAGTLRIKKKESIKDEIYESFVRDWKSDEKEPSPGEEETFFQKFFRMFVQTYEYELYKESVNKFKYHFYKLLVLFVILSIPFLALFLITRKEVIFNDSEWNDMYLYSVILVPLIFAYLLNKFIKLRQYYETWYRHLQHRHFMEWRMVVFVKDFELHKDISNPDQQAVPMKSLKTDFINDMCDYWKTSTTEISLNKALKEENLFDEITSLFGKK